MASPNTEDPNHYDEENLLFEHDVLLSSIKTRSCLGGGRTVQLQSGNLVELDEYLPIKIRDLVPDIDNTNKFLYLRIVSRIAVCESIRFIVEDEDGDACRVILPVNVDTGKLVIGVEIAFRHPFYVLAFDEKCTLTVYDISDVFVFGRCPCPKRDLELEKLQAMSLEDNSNQKSLTPQPQDQQVDNLPEYYNFPFHPKTTPKHSKREKKRRKQSDPSPQSLENDCFALCEVGHKLFREGRYLQAMEKYTRAIQVNDKEHIFLFNRARCFAYLLYYEEALDDYIKAISLNPHSESYQHAFALTWSVLGHHKKSLDILRKIKTNDIIMAETVSNLSEHAEMLTKQTRGEFDFRKLKEEYIASPDTGFTIGEYIGPIQIRKNRSSGRGLVTTRKVSKGENICVVMAADYNPGESSLGSCTDCRQSFFESFMSELVTFNRRIMETARESKLMTVRLITLLDQSINDADVNLYSGIGYDCAKNFDTTPFSLDKVRSLVQKYLTLDADKLIISHQIENAQYAYPKEFNKPFGVWLLPSFINESCIPNAIKIFMGNICIVRAITDIPKGEEITTCSEPLALFHSTEPRDCNCLLCVFEMKTQVKRINHQIFIIIERIEQFRIPLCTCTVPLPIGIAKISMQEWHDLQDTLLELIHKVHLLSTYEIYSPLFQTAIVLLLRITPPDFDALELCLKAEPYFSHIEPETYVIFLDIYVGRVRAIGELRDNRFQHVERKYQQALDLLT